MIFAGINRKVTDILPDEGVSYFQKNVRMFVDQELQRRHGFAASNMPQAAGPILGLATAYTPNGPIVVSQTNGVLNGNVKILPKWDDIKLGKPIGVVIIACNIYSFFDTNVFGTTKNYTLPVSSCAGTCTVSGTDNNRIGPYYGYQFNVYANAILILSSGCFVNGGTSVAIPAGTSTVQVVITGGCSGAGSPGMWTVQVTSP